MDFKLQLSRLGSFFERLDLMPVLVLGLLLSNCLTGTLAWYTSLHQKVEVTPFSGGDAYQNSDLTIDHHYLLMMIENFMYARLNVTPETVRMHHKRLLSFADVKTYPELLAVLNQEARLVQSKKISSHFEIKDIQVNPKTRESKIKGILKQVIQSRTHATPVTYQLQYQYRLGRLVITRFERLDQAEEQHAGRKKRDVKKQK